MPTISEMTNGDGSWVKELDLGFFSTLALETELSNAKRKVAQQERAIEWLLTKIQAVSLA